MVVEVGAKRCKPHRWIVQPLRSYSWHCAVDYYIHKYAPTIKFGSLTSKGRNRTKSNNEQSNKNASNKHMNTQPAKLYG